MAKNGMESAGMDWNGPKLAGMDLNGIQRAGRARSKWDDLIIILTVSCVDQ